MINRKIVYEVGAFGVVGVLATATHYFAALLLIEGMALGVYSANVIAYITALGVSYIGHSLVTFRVAMQRRVFAKFLVCSVAIFLASQALLWVAQQLFSGNHRLSLAIVVFFIPAVSYVVNKFIVYRR